MRDTALLLVAKAPVPGLVKTRLCPPATPHQAARIAAACLLDTLDALATTPAREVVVSLAGHLEDAVAAAALVSALRRCRVVPQRGEDFGARLATAHRDTGGPLLQIGMDTPQITPAHLGSALARLRQADAVIGPAEDGGWWALGLNDAADAAALRDVPMSTSDTCAETVAALRRRGRTVAVADTLRDVDTVADAEAVAAIAPGTRFATELRMLRVTV